MDLLLQDTERQLRNKEQHLSERDEQLLEREWELERKEMKHNGTQWHMPQSTSDCVLGPNGEVTGAAGCKQWPVQAAAKAALV